MIAGQTFNNIGKTEQVSPSRAVSLDRLIGTHKDLTSTVRTGRADLV